MVKMVKKKYLVHRFVWECFNGLILDDKVIDYTFTKDSYRNRKCVKATNFYTHEVLYFNSMYCCSKHLDISPGTIKKSL